MSEFNPDVLWVAVLMLAWANGENDVCKGVATLLGSGAGYRSWWPGMNLSDVKLL